MTGVFYIHINKYLKITNRPVHDIQVGDIGILSGYQVRQLAQRSRFIANHNLDTSRMIFRLGIAPPGYIQPAFRFIGI